MNTTTMYCKKTQNNRYTFTHHTLIRHISRLVRDNQLIDFIIQVGSARLIEIVTVKNKALFKTRDENK
jgi:hypothetical protein